MTAIIHRLPGHELGQPPIKTPWGKAQMITQGNGPYYSKKMREFPVRFSSWSG